MTIPTAAYGIASFGTMTAAAVTVPDPAPGILWAAGLLGAIVAICKFLHVGEITKGVLHLLRDYNGEPARPGAEARPGLFDRLAKIENQTHEIKGRDAQLVVALEQLASSANENGMKIDRLDDRVLGLDERVTDHRRRNDETASLLRAELERRAADLEQKLQARNDLVDKRLASLGDERLHAETMRASLSEILGIPLEPPHRP